jgi:hypothetical protein
MTAVNLAVGDDRVMLLTDSLVTGDPLGATFADKCLALPCLGLITACAGERALSAAWRSWLVSDVFPASTTGADIAAVAPDILRELWRSRGCTHPSVVFVGYLHGETAFAMSYASEADFAPVAYLRGAYCFPPLRPPAQSCDSKRTHESVFSAAPREHSWADYFGAITGCLGRQAAEHPGTIGGAVFATELSVAGIRTFHVTDLPVGIAREAAA